jgi:hypothetical protein
MQRPHLTIAQPAPPDALLPPEPVEVPAAVRRADELSRLMAQGTGDHLPIELRLRAETLVDEAR